MNSQNAVLPYKNLTFSFYIKAMRSNIYCQIQYSLQNNHWVTVANTTNISNTIHKRHHTISQQHTPLITLKIKISAFGNANSSTNSCYFDEFEFNGQPSRMETTNEIYDIDPFENDPVKNSKLTQYLPFFMKPLMTIPGVIISSSTLFLCCLCMSSCITLYCVCQKRKNAKSKFSDSRGNPLEMGDLASMYVPETHGHRPQRPRAEINDDHSMFEEAPARTSDWRVEAIRQQQSSSQHYQIQSNDIMKRKQDSHLKPKARPIKYAASTHNIASPKSLASAPAQDKRRHQRKAAKINKQNMGTSFSMRKVGGKKNFTKNEQKNEDSDVSESVETDDTASTSVAMPAAAAAAAAADSGYHSDRDKRVQSSHRRSITVNAPKIRHSQKNGKRFSGSKNKQHHRGSQTTVFRPIHENQLYPQAGMVTHVYHHGQQYAFPMASQNGLFLSSTPQPYHQHQHSGYSGSTTPYMNTGQAGGQIPQLGFNHVTSFSPDEVASLANAQFLLQNSPHSSQRNFMYPLQPQGRSQRSLTLQDLAPPPPPSVPFDSRSQNIMDAGVHRLSKPGIMRKAKSSSPRRESQRQHEELPPNYNNQRSTESYTSRRSTKSAAIKKHPINLQYKQHSFDIMEQKQGKEAAAAADPEPVLPDLNYNNGTFQSETFLKQEAQGRNHMVNFKDMLSPGAANAIYGDGNNIISPMDSTGFVMHGREIIKGYQPNVIYEAGNQKIELQLSNVVGKGGGNEIPESMPNEPQISFNVSEELPTAVFENLGQSGQFDDESSETDSTESEPGVDKVRKQFT